MGSFGEVGEAGEINSIDQSLPLYFVAKSPSLSSDVDVGHSLIETEIRRRQSNFEMVEKGVFLFFVPCERRSGHDPSLFDKIDKKSRKGLFGIESSRIFCQTSLFKDFQILLKDKVISKKGRAVLI